MSRGEKCDSIPKIVIAGIENANKLNESWTGETGWLSGAPEYLVGVEIAKLLGKRLKKRRISMESSVRQAMNDAGSMKRGRPTLAHRVKGRYDVLVSREGGAPWCVIEVKTRVWSATTLKDDIRRIRDTLAHRNHCASISCAALAIYSDQGPPQRKHKSAKAWLSSLEVAVQKLADRILDDKDARAAGISATVIPGSFHKSGDEGWQAFCLFFKAKRSRKASA